MDRQRIANALLLLRLGVFIVMIMWTLDKFINPQHAGAVFENFYGLSGFPGAAFKVIGFLQLLVVLAFVAGFMKRYSYGLILVLHGISTLSSWQQYLDAFNNLLFFAAWPMLAACIALYMLRDLDTRWTVDDRMNSVSPAAGG
ncbi:MAG: hypothetical protein NXH81_02840 [Halieaceae bacterium]|uniref:hypothetical protein n=1 Tax=Haliea alexandrii TaxID=2448162 RepID=UPI001E4460DB|nr:hypothetical protein [Haliea alexandrii]MCR9184316.1 hypothetical protein [Halieaceae bacterium]